MNIKSFMFLAIAIFFAQCKSNEDANIGVQNGKTASEGMEIPVGDTSGVIPMPVRPLATPTKDQEFCYAGGGASLNISDDGYFIKGSFTYKNQLDGTFLGDMSGDTIKVIVLNSVKDKTGPCEAWFVKDGNNLQYLSGKQQKDAKGVNKFENPDEVKQIATLLVGECR